MKIRILLFLLIFTILPVKGEECHYVCPSSQWTENIEKESIINKITGIGLLSKKAVETIIQKELKDELNSDTNVVLESYNVKRLKNGEFKSLKIESNNLKYKAFSMSNVNAETLCPYNKVVYKNGRIYYPEDMAFKFKGNITNQDLENIVNSKEFQKKWDEIRYQTGILGSNNFTMKQPSVFLKDNKLHFKTEIGTPLITTKIKFKTGIQVQDNQIVLKNINENLFTNILKEKILSLFTGLDSLNTKYCKIYITNAKIFDNIIKAEGILIINKNYDGEK